MFSPIAMIVTTLIGLGLGTGFLLFKKLTVRKVSRREKATRKIAQILHDYFYSKVEITSTDIIYLVAGIQSNIALNVLGGLRTKDVEKLIELSEENELTIAEALYLNSELLRDLLLIKKKDPDAKKISDK